MLGKNLTHFCILYSGNEHELHPLCRSGISSLQTSFVAFFWLICGARGAAHAFVYLYLLRPLNCDEKGVSFKASKKSG